jgi:PAS domain S-box-containing protein
VSTIAGSLVARGLAERDARRDSDRRVELAAALIGSRISEATSLATSLRRFISTEGAAGVTNDQFARIALRWLDPAEVPAAAWVEQIPAGDRADYERRLGHAIVTPEQVGKTEPPRSSYLPATLVSGYPPLDVRGIDLGLEPGILEAVARAEDPGGVAATPFAARRDGTSGLFLIAQSANVIYGRLRPGAVVVFVSEETLRAAARNPAGLEFVAAGSPADGHTGADTVREEFTVAGRRLAVVMPRASVGDAGAVLPWLILAAGLVLAGLTGALGVHATRRARAQAELDRIFNLSADLIVVADFEGRFTRVNPAVEQVLGYTEEEILNHPYLDFVHPEDRDRTAAEAAALGKGRTTRSFENRYRRKDGSYRVLEWTSTPVANDGVMYGVARDVTERRQSEIELAASRRRIVAASDDARRRIERDLHDGVQQRLVSLRLELGAMKADPPTGDALKEQLAAIREDVGSVLDALLETARGIHPAILSHGGLAAAVKALARRCAVTVAVDAHIDVRLPDEIEVAAYYVASEALTNVAKYAHASAVHIDMTTADGTLTLAVRDDGVGGADPGGGSGLVGLRDRVEALGGTITIDSTAERGTCIVVTLPIPAEPDQEIEDVVRPQREPESQSSPA